MKGIVLITQALILQQVWSLAVPGLNLANALGPAGVLPAVGASALGANLGAFPGTFGSNILANEGLFLPNAIANNVLPNAIGPLAIPTPVINNAQVTPIISEIIPALSYGDITLAGDMPIGGTIKVRGCFPVYGMVAVDGSVPSAGKAFVTEALGSQVLDVVGQCARQLLA